jgi:acetylornithine deacetylase/succinyl-diaminopimelate desuccinylase-like protein
VGTFEIIDWSEVGREAAHLLADYIRIDTTNPPGNERAAMDFLAAQLARDGIASERLALDPARPNLLARLRGSGEEPALVLLHHADVVPAGEGWSVEPLAGVERDGRLFGRGALDCKSLGIMHLMALRLLARAEVPLRREVWLLAVSDEERGGGLGAQWLCREHAGLFGQASDLLGEGGIGLAMPSGESLWLPSYAEKGILWLELTARGEGGHAALGGPGPAERMARVLARLSERTPEVFITAEAERNLRALAGRARFPLSWFLSHPRSPVTRRLVRHAARRNDWTRALMCSTFSVTALEASAAENQIPISCRATLDCRLHPADRREACLARVAEEASREGITVQETLYAPPSRSSIDTPLFVAMAETLRRLGPTPHVAPALFPGTTDNRFFRELGLNCYGLLPILLPLGEHEVHGPDERIELSQLERGCRIMAEIVAAVATGAREAA